jgi:hypothetical protein
MIKQQQQPAMYRWFPGNNPGQTIMSGSTPGPQPGNPDLLLTLAEVRDAGKVVAPNGQRPRLIEDVAG